MFISKEILPFQDFQELEKTRKNMRKIKKKLKRIIWLPLTTGILFIVLTPLEIAIGTVVIILDIAFAKSIILDRIERSLEGIEEDYGYMKNSIRELFFEGL